MTIKQQTILEVVERLKQAAPNAMIILFGSHARGDAGPGSDLDILVVEPVVTARREEMVRLSRVLRPLRIPVDILVTSRQNYDKWSQARGTVLYRAAREGVVLHDGT